MRGLILAVLNSKSEHVSRGEAEEGLDELAHEASNQLYKEIGPRAPKLRRRIGGR